MQALFFNHLYDAISLVRDNEVKAAMCSLGVHCQSFNGDVLYEPWEVLAEGARPFTTFATFWNRCADSLPPPSQHTGQEATATARATCAPRSPALEGHASCSLAGSASCVRRACQ